MVLCRRCRTWLLCCTLVLTIGLTASSRSSFNADAAMFGVVGHYKPRLITMQSCDDAVAGQQARPGRSFGPRGSTGSTGSTGVR